jgi:hypothetical protein
MPVIRETLLDFDPRTNQLVLRRSDLVPADWVDLVSGAITVGRRSRFDVFQFGFASMMEVVWRAALLRANLALGREARYSPRAQFERSPAFWALDGSEKGAVTYFLGLALAKLAAERHWDVPWVLHLDVYSRPTGPYGRPVNVVLQGAGRRRPDLIGQSPSGDWLVLEAKGRTGHVDDKLRRDSKEQTRLISTINGRSPKWRIASIGSFRGGALAVDLIDPADPVPDAVPLDLPHEDFLRTYYALTLGLVRDGVIVIVGPHERAFITRSIPDADLTVGLDKRLYLELMRDEENADAHGLHERLRDLLAHEPGAESGRGEGIERVGRDGIFVRLGSRWFTEIAEDHG